MRVFLGIIAGVARRSKDLILDFGIYQGLAAGTRLFAQYTRSGEG